MFGSLGLPEILLILVLALLIFGPKRLPEVGRTIGKGLAEFRRASSELKRSVNAELALDEEERTSTPRRLELGGAFERPAAPPAEAAAQPTAPAGATPRESPPEAAAAPPATPPNDPIAPGEGSSAPVAEEAAPIAPGPPAEAGGDR